jgi:chromosomal replication initiator protein
VVEITLETLWIQVLERLQLQLSRPTFETWIKTAIAEQLDDNCLVIRTPNPFARNWLQKYYIKTIAEVVQEVIGHPIDIHITIAQGDDAAESPEMFWPLPSHENVAEPAHRTRQRQQTTVRAALSIPNMSSRDWSLVQITAWRMQRR